MSPGWLLSRAGGGKGSCRFCGTTSNTGLLSIGNVCADPECQKRVDLTCDKTLSCGHPCNGVKDEEVCLPCLFGCATDNPKLRQDADDMCMICYTEGLSCAPCIQVINHTPIIIGNCILIVTVCFYCSWVVVMFFIITAVVILLVSAGQVQG